VKRLPLGIDKKWTVCTLRLVRIDPDILVIVESLCFYIGAGCECPEDLVCKGQCKEVVNRTIQDLILLGPQYA
jgi:hypothetical protein